MPTTRPRARVIQPLFLPWDAQIEIEYNLRRPSIRTIVRQVEVLGYWVIVGHFQCQREIINRGFTSQRVGAHLLLIYPPPFDPQWNGEEIATELLQQVHIYSVEVEVTEDLFNIDGSAPYPKFEDPSLELYGLTAIQYQIIFWLQREYGEPVQVEYTV